MQTINNKIANSGDKFENQLKYPYDGLVNNKNYVIQLNTESQNPNRSIGMINNVDKRFFVEYVDLQLKNKPILTEILDKSAIQIYWAGIYKNPGTLIGNYEYVKPFILKNNVALHLGSDGILQYSTTIPKGFTLEFMIKLSYDYNGLIFTTNNNNYQVGYDNGKHKFYINIEGELVYSELIKITENPFFITCVNNHIIIRQYNIYKKLSNIKNFKLLSMTGFPLQFMNQTNN